MNPKQRVLAAMEGRPVDRLPVTVAYAQLYHEDHFAELTGLAPWEVVRWRYMGRDDHLRLYRQMVLAAPFDILQPQIGPARQDREDTEFVLRDGVPFLHNRRRDQWRPIRIRAGHPKADLPHETQHVFDERDVDRRVRPRRAEDRIADGSLDNAKAVADTLGTDHFVMAGGVIGTLYSCSWHVGLTNLWGLLIDRPRLIEHLSRRILEDNVEAIRALAWCGGDAIYIDDAMSTSDMISPAMYGRFCLPLVAQMVDEIHRLGQKAVLIYFGGVADRLEMILSTGADGLLVETSMKGYTNDIVDFARRAGRRMTLFGNVDPVGLLEKASDASLEAEMRRQATAAENARGFIMSTGSPVTPGTPLHRVRRFIELAHGLPSSVSSDPAST